MAYFKNRVTDCVVYPNKSEERCSYLLSKLPPNWMFWHEPRIQGNHTPDFVIWCPEAENPGLIVLELKNWRGDYIISADKKFVYLKDNRREYNPLPKLDMIIKELNDCFAINYNSVFGLEKIPVIPILAFWDELPTSREKIIRHSYRTMIIDRSIIQNPKKLANYIRDAIKNEYKIVVDDPPVVSNVIKRTIISDVDMNFTVPVASGIIKENKHDPKKSIKTVRGPIDKYQEDIVRSLGSGHRLLRGISGTGKTIILMAKANILSQKYPEKKISFIVHQRVLCENLKQKFKYYYSNDNENVEFLTFRQWLIKNYDIPKTDLDITSADREANDWVEKIFSGKIEKKTGSKVSDHAFVDEAHQMPPKWLSLFIRHVSGYKEKHPNIWIAYDNGQGFYKNVSFKGEAIGLNFRGRSKVLNRVYRSGLRPWLFAACCHENALKIYESEFVNRLHKKDKILEFTRLGNRPERIQGKTLKEQAEKLHTSLKKIFETTEHSYGDVIIFYSKVGRSEDPKYRDENIMEILNGEFKDHGGIEWVAVDKRNADWTTDRIRACPFTSSQGLDAPISVIFGIETFEIIGKAKWINEEPLFYTILTRATDNIIVTYSDIFEGENPFYGSFMKGIERASKIMPKIEKFTPVRSLIDNKEVYRISWENMIKFLRE